MRHGVGHGPYRARRLDMPCEIFIRHHASRWNTQECLPYLYLEICPTHMQVDVVRVTVAALEQPLRDRSDHAWCFLEMRARPFGHEFRERAPVIFLRQEAEVTNAA